MDCFGARVAAARRNVGGRVASCQCPYPPANRAWPWSGGAVLRAVAAPSTLAPLPSQLIRETPSQSDERPLQSGDARLGRRMLALSEVEGILVEPSDKLDPHPYVVGCPWCGRAARRSMEGLLMKVLRASVEKAPGPSGPCQRPAPWKAND